MYSTLTCAGGADVAPHGPAPRPPRPTRQSPLIQQTQVSPSRHSSGAQDPRPRLARVPSPRPRTTYESGSSSQQPHTSQLGASQPIMYPQPDPSQPHCSQTEMYPQPDPSQPGSSRGQPPVMYQLGMPLSYGYGMQPGYQFTVPHGYGMQPPPHVGWNPSSLPLHQFPSHLSKYFIILARSNYIHHDRLFTNNVRVQVGGRTLHKQSSMTTSCSTLHRRPRRRRHSPRRRRHRHIRRRSRCEAEGCVTTTLQIACHPPALDRVGRHGLVLTGMTDATVYETSLYMRLIYV